MATMTPWESRADRAAGVGKQEEAVEQLKQAGEYADNWV